MAKSGSNSHRSPRVLELCRLAALVGSMMFLPNPLRADCKPAMALSPGDHNYDLEFGGMTRSYVLHVPPGYDGGKPVPLVFDLHGFSSNGPQQLGLSGFPAVADKNGFLVVAPNGYMNSWNGDIAFGAAYMAMLDDVGLMKAIVDDIAGKANVNRGKVYATGLSNGAAMSNTLGCQATDTFAAVAPVADPLDIGRDTCMPAQPTAVLGFHGYDDEYVPYEGGEGSGPRLPAPFPSIPDTLAAWAEIMHCTGMPEVDTIEGRNKCEIYRECAGGTQVGYCSLEGGHVLYQQSHLNIAEYAWKFFDQFSLPLPDADGDGIGDADDNCVHVANPDQSDDNANCVGDACECSTPSDCDDGMFCSGVEACNAGVCEPGAAPCSAAQSCDEAARQCTDASGSPAQSQAQAGTDAAAGSGATGSGQAGIGAMSEAVSADGMAAATPGDAAAATGAARAGAAAAPDAAGGAGQAAASLSTGQSQPAADAMSAGGCGCYVVAGERARPTQTPRRAGRLHLALVLLGATLWRAGRGRRRASRRDVPRRG